MSLSSFNDLKILFVGEGTSDVGNSKGGLVAPLCCIFVNRATTHTGLNGWERDYIESAIDPKKLASDSRFISRIDLAKASHFPKKHITRPGLKRKDPRLVHLYNVANDLALLAKKEGYEFAVLFHDADKSDFQEAYTAIKDGFQGFDGGIPVVPNPTSEAWILAVLLNQKNHNVINASNAHRFENNLHGNDKSENSAKAKLAREISNNPDKMSVDYKRIIDGFSVEDWLRIEVLPSFKLFLQATDEAILTVCRRT